MKSAPTSSPRHRTGTRRSTLRSPEPWIALAWIGLALGSGCADPRGNDPNLPDLGGATAIDAAPPASCPKALPSSCTTTPSFARDVDPIVNRSCVPGCHQRGGTSSDRDLTTYGGVTRLETTIMTQVNACLMPPADAGPDAAVSLADRTTLLEWIVCGAPDN